MRAVVNGNVWAGACVNGDAVSGLVKNGVVFYKKEVQELYKRRIMVGDNLRNKVVYGDFEMGYYVTLMNADEEDSITCNNNYFDTVYEYITSDYCSVDNNMHDSSSNLSLYEYDATNGTELLNNNSLIKNDKDYIVSEIIDNATYRHLFIKDPNIRPIEVGDIITENTKFYFNVPDDFYLQEPPVLHGKDVDVIVLNNDLHKFKLRSRDDKIYTAFYLDTMRAEEGNMYEYNRETGVLVKNTSMIVGPHRTYQNMHFEGTVTSVAKDSTIYPYILVDTTTLGE